MLTVGNFKGSVPWGVECDYELLTLLPVGIYVQLNYPAKPRTGRLIQNIHPDTGKAVVEVHGNRLFSYQQFPFVPIRDTDALAKVPLGTEVSFYAAAPADHYAQLTDGFVAAQLERRVRVTYVHDDGTPGERDLYVSQLLNV